MSRCVKALVFIVTAYHFMVIFDPLVALRVTVWKEMWKSKGFAWHLNAGLRSHQHFFMM
jgi:hypothetical protein